MTEIIVKVFLYRIRRRSRVVGRFPTTDEGHAKAIALKERINKREKSELRAEWYVIDI